MFDIENRDIFIEKTKKASIVAGTVAVTAAAAITAPLTLVGVGALVMGITKGKDALEKWGKEKPSKEKIAPVPPDTPWFKDYERLCQKAGLKEVPPVYFTDNPNTVAEVRKIKGGDALFLNTQNLEEEIPAEFLGVLSHEIAHIRGKHRQKMNLLVDTFYGVSTTFAVTVGAVTPMLTLPVMLMGLGITYLTSRTLSRQHELEADRVGSQLVGCYAPLRDRFSEMKEEEDFFGESESKLKQIFSTHPTMEKRADILDRAMKKGAQEYEAEQIKKGLTPEQISRAIHCVTTASGADPCAEGVVMVQRLDDRQDLSVPPQPYIEKPGLFGRENPPPYRLHI